MHRRHIPILIAYVVTLLLTAFLLMYCSAPEANATGYRADPTPAPSGLYVKRAVPVKTGPMRDKPALWVKLSNGQNRVLTPCRYEDGRKCYWVADVRGNRRGQSFVVMSGHIFYLDLTGVPT